MISNTSPVKTCGSGYLQIQEIIDRETATMLRPLECMASDGKRYFVKSRRTDRRPLICEWVCSRLAKVLNLQCPEVKIAHLSRDLLDGFGVSDYDLVPSLVFCSEAVGLADTFPKAATREVYQENRRKLLAFDYWIHNADRRDANPNLLWQAHKKTMWLIDHHETLAPEPIRPIETTHIFRNEWPNLWIEDNGSDLRSWIKDGYSHLETILEELPREWTEGLEDILIDIPNLLGRDLPYSNNHSSS